MTRYSQRHHVVSHRAWRRWPGLGEMDLERWHDGEQAYVEGARNQMRRSTRSIVITSTSNRCAEARAAGGHPIVTGCHRAARPLSLRGRVHRACLRPPTHHAAAARRRLPRRRGHQRGHPRSCSPLRPQSREGSQVRLREGPSGSPCPGMRAAPGRRVRRRSGSSHRSSRFAAGPGRRRPTGPGWRDLRPWCPRAPC